MSEDGATLETLDRKVAELTSFLSPGEIFRALLEGTAAGAPRTAVFLLREGRWKGWSSIGYPAPAAQKQRQAVLSPDEGWLSALAREEDVRWQSLVSGESGPDFGQGRYAETVGLPVRVGGKAVAILIAERATGERPWSPPALSILCHAARLRLELDLAWRRLRSGGHPERMEPLVTARREPVAAMPPEGAVGPAAPVVAVAEAPSSTATELAPYGGAGGGSSEPDPRREEARRYARLVATDIRLYNEEAVVVGRRQRDLATRLREHLQRGRESFARRFPDLGPEGAELLDEAYVHVLAGGDASLLP